MESFDAIVVGGGHNGLVAAAYLSRGGLRTLVLERRETIGGCCVTEEIAPGCRASTTSYIASMLRPEVIRDLDLPRHGLSMVPCDPGIFVPFEDGSSLAWWADRPRTLREIERFSKKDARAFQMMDDRLKKLARYLQPFFLEPPPKLHGHGMTLFTEGLKILRRFHGIEGHEISEMVSLLTGSLGTYLDRTFESDKVKSLVLANSVYGKHGGPYHGGSAIGLLFHLLSGGEHERQGFYGHVIGGMGTITRAIEAAAREFGAEIRTSAPVARIETREGRVAGVLLEDGTPISGRVVLSNADPKRTFLSLVEEGQLPEDFREAIRGIKMDGPCAKVNLVLSEEPGLGAMSKGFAKSERALFTLVPTLAGAERMYNAAWEGRIPEELWVDCVVATNVDTSLAPPDRHIMTCFVQYVPYRLREGTWDENREVLGDLVLRKIGEFAPNVPQAVLHRQVLTPLDLERIYGITEGNIFHGDLSLEQLFFMRPVPGFSDYRSPLAGLYLCGAGAHPGGGVTGAPGHNAAKRVLADLRRTGSRPVARSGG